MFFLQGAPFRESWEKSQYGKEEYILASIGTSLAQNCIADNVLAGIYRYLDRQRMI